MTHAIKRESRRLERLNLQPVYRISSPVMMENVLILKRGISIIYSFLKVKNVKLMKLRLNCSKSQKKNTHKNA